MPDPNCYAYATKYADRLDPGQFSGGRAKSNSVAAIRAAVLRDGLILCPVQNALPPALAGHYIVACRRASANTYDYHWFRREGVDSWSHKPGTGVVRSSDASGEAITDTVNAPHTASYNFTQFFTGKNAALLPMAQQQGWAIDYDEFVGYFYCPDEGLKMRKGCTIL
ncbi:hypothetical protein [Falsiroseomonas oryzae]|uniref:hypothetical protein n=1 Tax=Falsiroseomonas oryzae TaxID=2766473 RepID=UPI0022EB9CBD|nr:hypothetical protein [Roseomonas sp. MO-31]